MQAACRALENYLNKNALRRRARLLVLPFLVLWSAWLGAQGSINVALASKGATVTASSTMSSAYPAASVINGDRLGLNWGNGGGWSSAGRWSGFDWLQVNFAGQKTIAEIDIFTIQDGYWAPNALTPTSTFYQYGITAFYLQTWNGSQWVTIPSSVTSGNHLVWKKFTFAPITTDKIRLVMTDSPDGYSRVAEIEAWSVVPPVVTLTSPAANTLLTAPANVTLTANATDSDGSVTKVEFYQGTTLIGTATSAPYSVTWSNVPSGTYNLTAKATDNQGNTTTSAVVPIIVNVLPSVTVTSPAAGQSFTAPATINLTAEANDADGTIAKVEFFKDNVLMGIATSVPYSIAWANVPAGNYSITAKATDNRGMSTVSAPVVVAVTVGNGGPATVYYLHSDHLDTPRLATTAQNTVVWRRTPLDEPFGASPPEEDPDGDGVPFVLNLRFPGQYFDQETNLNYNYFRDYDPATGRYRQSDPIGLQGGINTYLYVGGNPLSFVDPLGLARTTGAVPGQNGGGFGGYYGGGYSGGAGSSIGGIAGAAAGLSLAVGIGSGSSSQSSANSEQCKPDDFCERNKKRLEKERNFLIDAGDLIRKTGDNESIIALSNDINKFNREVREHNKMCPNHTVLGLAPPR